MAFTVQLCDTLIKSASQSPKGKLFFPVFDQSHMLPPFPDLPFYVPMWSIPVWTVDVHRSSVQWWGSFVGGPSCPRDWPRGDNAFLLEASAHVLVGDQRVTLSLEVANVVSYKISTSSTGTKQTKTIEPSTLLCYKLFVYFRIKEIKEKKIDKEDSVWTFCSTSICICIPCTYLEKTLHPSACWTIKLK